MAAPVAGLDRGSRRPERSRPSSGRVGNRPRPAVDPAGSRHEPAAASDRPRLGERVRGGRARAIAGPTRSSRRRGPRCSIARGRRSLLEEPGPGPAPAQERIRRSIRPSPARRSAGAISRSRSRRLRDPGRASAMPRAAARAFPSPGTRCPRAASSWPRRPWRPRRRTVDEILPRLRLTEEQFKSADSSPSASRCARSSPALPAFQTDYTLSERSHAAPRPRVLHGRRRARVRLHVPGR